MLWLSGLKRKIRSSLTEEHHQIDKVHPVHRQRLQKVEEREAAHRSPVQVFIVQVTEAAFLCDVYGHQHTCK